MTHCPREVNYPRFLFTPQGLMDCEMDRRFAIAVILVLYWKLMARLWI